MNLLAFEDEGITILREAKTSVDYIIVTSQKPASTCASL
jgi:hypothetical protein